jgi:hypothetical protein
MRDYAAADQVWPRLAAALDLVCPAPEARRGRILRRAS